VNLPCEFDLIIPSYNVAVGYRLWNDLKVIEAGAEFVVKTSNKMSARNLIEVSVFITTKYYIIFLLFNIYMQKTYNKIKNIRT
jgi:hypothetical protein